MRKAKILILSLCLMLIGMVLPAAAEPCCWYGDCTTTPGQEPDRCLYYYDASQQQWCSCTCECYNVTKYCQLVLSQDQNCEEVIIPQWWTEYYTGVCSADACGDYPACSSEICFNLSGQYMGRRVWLWADCVQPG